MPRRAMPAICVTCLLAASGCGEIPTPNSLSKPSQSPVAGQVHSAPAPPREAAAASAPEPPAPVQSLFTDITEAAGVTNPAEPSWPDGTYMTPELTAGGVALFDYDGDGDLDIYQICHAPPGLLSTPSPNRLYQQQPDHTFREVPGAAGLDDPGCGYGVAIGDVDNDGDLDVYVTNFGRDAFYQNQGNGAFTNATAAAGFPREHHWSSSAGYLDYDRDGDLDLFVVRFAVFDPHKRCAGLAHDGIMDYCGPHTFEGTPDTLYRNNGDGTFTDVTQAAKINSPSRGWGLVTGDFNGDGWIDIYVANDEEPAELWINGQDGTFRGEGTVRGCAFNGAGRVEAGMGAAAGDVNGDGLLDLFKTHITSQSNTLYIAAADGLYRDATAEAGMSPIDRPHTGWGCAFLDFDLDRDLDLAVVNGRVTRGPVIRGANLGKFWNRYAEPKLLFANAGAGRFEFIGAQSGDFASRPEVTRGLAAGDIDEDGDIDLVASNLGNTIRIFRNDTPRVGRHWLAVRPRSGNRDAYGATVSLVVDGQRLVRQANPVYSYLASSDPRAHFGLGESMAVKELEVAWPDGTTEVFEVDGVDRTLVVSQGQGKRK